MYLAGEQDEHLQLIIWAHDVPFFFIPEPLHDAHFVCLHTFSSDSKQLSQFLRGMSQSFISL